MDAPQISRKVNVGAGAKLFGQIKVGDNIQIGANAVALNDIPPNNTAVGMPAKIISKSN